MHTDLIPNSSILYKVGTDGKKHESGRRLVRVDSIQASVFSSFNRVDHGPLYKGWGQFAWNGNEKGEPIKIDEIRASDHNDYIKDGKIDEEAVEKNTLDINKQKFFTMAYSPTTGKYVSATDSVYIKLAMMRASRLGEDDIVVDSINYNLNGEGLSAPVQMTESKSKGKTYSLGFSMGVSLGVNRSNTKQESYTTVSAMDLNGDSYPDWIRENNGKIRVPLTHQIGTLGDGQDYGVEPSMSYGESENTGGEPDSAWIPIAISFPISKNNLEKQQPLSLRVWQACNKPSDWIRMPKGRALAATSRKELAVPAVISQAEHQSPYVTGETLTETDCPI